MIYCIECINTGNKIWLQSNKINSKKEFEKLLKVIKFDLSHHVNIDDLYTILCRRHGFKIIENILF